MGSSVGTVSLLIGAAMLSMGVRMLYAASRADRGSPGTNFVQVNGDDVMT
jgi:hypothetical protein